MFKYVKYTKVDTGKTALEFRSQNEDVKVNHFDLDIVSLEGEEEAINALIDSQPDEINCEEITQDEFKTLFSQTARFKRIKQRVKEKYDADMDVLISLYPGTERETWQIQLNQALAYKESGDEADAPFLKTLADAEDATVDDFADAVIAKAKAYEEFSAQNLAKKRAFERELLSEIGL